MNIPLLDLKAQHSQVRAEILNAVTAVLDSQVCILGPKVAELEEKIGSLCGCRHAVGVSSGTDALLVSLMSLGVGAGDEVITTPFTFFATAGCIARVGAKPVFVDIDPLTYNLNPRLIRRAVTSRTKAIVPVHLFGQVCDMDPILAIAAKYNLHVIEDAAQAITATYKGHHAGSMGAAGCFSFFPSKNLGAAGDGGIVVTNDDEFAQRLALMRAHGASPKFYHRYVGGNFRLDPLQAAILLVKLPYLGAWTASRRRNAEYFNERFADTEIEVPWISPQCQSIYNQYVVRLKNRDQVASRLKQMGVATEVYYPLPMHMQECFKDLGYNRGAFPASEQAAEEVLALPCYPELTPSMLAYIADSLLEACRGVNAAAARAEG